jgi:transposase
LIDEDGMGDVILVDVKALSLRTKNGWKVNRTPTKKQKELDVQLIFVDLDTKEVLDAMPSKRDKKVKKYKETDTTNVVDIKWYKQWMTENV